MIQSVSIHAPVRERRHAASQTPDEASFNPRSREGATRGATLLHTMQDVSIHAPVRERRGSPRVYSQERGFNPRSREGATF